MNEQKIDLALTFLRSYPGPAAEILERQPIEHVAEFLSNVAHTDAASVAEKMLPQYTARLCKILEPTVAVGLLSEMETSLVASIMRHSGKALSKQLLGLLPDKTSIACRLRLNYSEDAVGAWMMANISTLPDDCSIEEALVRIRSEQQTIDTGTAYIVDRDQHLKGVLSLSTALRSAPNTPINMAMDRNQDSILARTGLSSAANHTAWAQRDNLPVINRNKQLVGVLRYCDLRKGLDQISTTVFQPEDASSITDIAEVYRTSLLLLFNTAADLARTKSSLRQ